MPPLRCKVQRTNNPKSQFSKNIRSRVYTYSTEWISRMGLYSTPDDVCGQHRDAFKPTSYANQATPFLKQRQCTWPPFPYRVRPYRRQQRQQSDLKNRVTSTSEWMKEWDLKKLKRSLCSYRNHQRHHRRPRSLFSNALSKPPTIYVRKRRTERPSVVIF